MEHKTFRSGCQKTILYIPLSHFPGGCVISGTSRFTVKDSSVLKNIFLSRLSRILTPVCMSAEKEKLAVSELVVVD